MRAGANEFLVWPIDDTPWKEAIGRTLVRLGFSPSARSVATTGLLDAIARKFNQDVIETPVGFKWIGAAIEEQGAILGGEESNGMSMAGHTPGKDGILADLILAERYCPALSTKPKRSASGSLARPTCALCFLTASCKVT